MTKVFTASDAKNQFGQVLDIAQGEPVRIRKNGRDVAVVMSAETYRELVEQAGSAKVSPAVKALHERSAERWAKVYQALAK